MITVLFIRAVVRNLVPSIMEIELLIRQAIEGDKVALKGIIELIQNVG